MTNEKITAIYTALQREENTVLINLAGNKLKKFQKFALDFISDSPVVIKAVLLASEYKFQYDNVKEQLEKLDSRAGSLEKQLKEWKKKSDAVIGGIWTLKQKKNGIEKEYTYAELKEMTIATLNDIDSKKADLRTKRDKLAEVLTAEVEALADAGLTDAEKIAFMLLRYDLIGSKCLDIRNSFVSLADACQKYNREKLANKTTKETYETMKAEFQNLAGLVKVTKDTAGDFMKVRTFSFNAEEMKILADTLFSSASIGTVETDGKSYYTLSADGRPKILNNIVKILIMKMQGTKITLDNIQ
jgi:hypothetical protein